MGIGMSILLIAVGAILHWAIHWNSQNVNISTIGVVLFVVGLVGLVLSMVLWGPWSNRTRSRRQVVDGVTGRTVLSDETTIDNAPRP